MARKASSISILQFGPSVISLLKVKLGLPGLKVTASEVQWGEWTAVADSLSEALAKFADANALSGDRLFTVLPRHEATLRVLELPSQSDEELEGMVRLGAEEIVPFSLEELVTGHCILEKLAHGSSRVLAVVVHRDVIEAHLSVLKAAGLVPEQIFLSTDSLMAAAKEAGGTGHEAFVHLSPGGVEVLVLKDGQYAYGRGIAVEHAWTGPEIDAAARAELVSEVRASLSTYQRESGEEEGAQAVYLSSECVETAELAVALGDALDLSCGEASQVVDVVRQGGDRVSYTPAAAIGAALIARRPDTHYVGLLPEVELKRREVVSSRLRFVRIAAMLTVAALALAGVYWQAVSQRMAYIEELDLRAEALRPLARSVGTKRKHLRMLQRQVEREATMLELLGSIADLAPDKGLNIIRFDYDRHRSISLYGRALETRSFDRLIDDLRGKGAQTFSQFAQAQESYRTLRKERSQEVWDFAIKIPFGREGEDDE